MARPEDKRTSAKDFGRDTPTLGELLERHAPPLHLPYKVRQFWTNTLASLPPEWFITADMHLFELYCITYCEYHEFSENARKEGRVYMDEKGVLRKNPWQEMAEKAKYSIMTMTGKLKFNPKSREADRAHQAEREAKKQQVQSQKSGRGDLLFIKGGKAS